MKRTQLTGVNAAPLAEVADVAVLAVARKVERRVRDVPRRRKERTKGRALGCAPEHFSKSQTFCTTHPLWRQSPRYAGGPYATFSGINCSGPGRVWISVEEWPKIKKGREKLHELANLRERACLTSHKALYEKSAIRANPRCQSSSVSERETLKVAIGSHL